MASYVVTSTHLTLNSVDMTSFIRSATLDMNADQAEFTNMASSGAREYKIALKSGTLSVEFNADYAASAVDASLWAIYNGAANVTFLIKPVNTTVGATNPSYSGSVTPGGYQAVGGAVGDGATVSISWNTTGTITRTAA